MPSMRVRVISESEFTVQGHGVHTAYVELTKALNEHDDVDVIVNARGDAVITHLHTVGLYSLGYMLFSSGKKVISAHVIPESFVGSLLGAKYWLGLAKAYLRWFYNQADLVLAVSEETKTNLEKLGVAKRIEVFHNVIDTSQYERQDGDRERARAALGLPEKGFIVIGAGQIQPRKRVDSFVDAARKLPDVTFIWVGGMPFKRAAADYGKMDQMIKTAPVNVIFPGILPLEAMKQYYHASDLFMLPSDQETFGLVVVEAAASGLPVVLRDIPDYDETFREDAVMVPSDEFAAAIRKLTDDEAHRHAMTDAAAHISQRFDSKTGAERLVALYRQLIDSN